MKLFTTTQPLFLPCTYMMARFTQVEGIIVMEEAQFHRKGHHARANIVTPQGRNHIGPALQKANRKPIDEILLSDPKKTLEKMQATIKMTYGKTKGFKQVGDGLLDALEYEKYAQMGTGDVALLDLCNGTLDWALQVSGISTPVYMSKDLVPERPEHASQWMADLGESVGLHVYYAGAASIDSYIRDEDFEPRGMGYKKQNYVMPSYENYGGIESNGWISFIDPLFHRGQDEYIGMIEYDD